MKGSSFLPFGDTDMLRVFKSSSQSRCFSIQEWIKTTSIATKWCFLFYHKRTKLYHLYKYRSNTDDHIK